MPDPDDPARLMEKLKESIKESIRPNVPQKPMSRQVRRAMETAMAKHGEPGARRRPAPLHGESPCYPRSSRNHPVRHAFPNEERNLRELYQTDPTARDFHPDRPLVILVKQFKPSVRVRKPTSLPDGLEIDPEEMSLLTEEPSRRIFEI